MPIARPETIRLAIEAAQRELIAVKSGKRGAEDLLKAYHSEYGGTVAQNAKRYASDQVRIIQRLRNVLEFREGEKF